MGIIEELLFQSNMGSRRVVFPEGNDARILQAAKRLYSDHAVVPILIGNPTDIQSNAKHTGIDLAGVTLLDPSTYPQDKLDEFADIYIQGRPGSKIEIARRLMRKPLFFGSMLVKANEADAIVAGTSHPTARIIEAGMMSVGLTESVNTPSSFFLMLVPTAGGGETRRLIFADCAVNVDPTSAQLADIAIASAASAASLLAEPPRVAMLSFSTKGSARHPLVEKVQEALDIVRQRAPELTIDGEFQADTALSQVVAANKVKEPSQVAGHANVLVFPDLNSGNIGYKLTQYLAGAMAVGPMLQGFAKPICDLSRGASVDDIIAATAIALAQSAR